MIIERDNISNRIIDETKITNANKSQLIAKDISEIYENVLVIYDSNELNNYVLHPNVSNREELSHMLQRIINNKSDYLEICFADLAGQEIVHVTNWGDSIKIESEDELEDIGNTDCFKNAIALQKEELYISPLVLEPLSGNDSEEQPLIHVAMAVYDENNEVQGVLAISYHAQYFFDVMKSANEINEQYDSEIYVLDQNNEWLIYPNETSDLQIRRGKENLVETTPDLLKLVHQEDFGFGCIDNQIIVYENLLNQITEEHIISDNQWIVITSTNKETIFSGLLFMNRLLEVYSIVIVISLMFFSFVTAWLYERLKKKDHMLEITEKIADSTSDAVVITDPETKIIYVNEAYEKASGYHAVEVIGSKTNRFKSGKHNSEFYKRMWDEIEENGYWEGVLWDRKKDGLLYPKRLRILSLLEKDNKTVHHYLGIFTDLSDSKQQTCKYEGLNYNDGQIVLANEEIMLDLLRRSIEKNPEEMMVLYVNIENYNQIVASFQEESISWSEQFVALVQPLLKDADLIAQTGRTLFMLIISKETFGNEPVEFVKMLYSVMSNVMDVHGRNQFFKVHIGASFWPNDTSDLKRLFLNSLIALDWSYSRHGSEITYFTDEMTKKLNQSNEIEGLLRTAAVKNELYLVYQPQIEISTGEIIGVEALIRWNNEKLGIVPPNVFIPIAEENNLMIELGDWIMERACQDLRRLCDMIPKYDSEFRCAINISSVQMEEPAFLEKLQRLLETYQIGGSHVEIELTESLLLTDMDKNIQKLEQIRSQGMTIAIDDFGTGYSSLSYLNSLPVDKIKIDRGFVKDFPDTDDGKLLNMLVDMAKGLGKKVLTEGVETKEQMEFLKSVECDYIQGFYYSKPLEFDDLLLYLNKQVK